MTNEKANPKLTLEKAQDQFAILRKTRRKRGSIPKKLWNVAISLAETYTFHQISKGLHLNHTVLKDRVEAWRVMPSGVVGTLFQC